MNISNEVLNNVSPGCKKRAVKRLKLSNPAESVKKALRLDRVKSGSGGRK